MVTVSQLCMFGETIKLQYTKNIRKDQGTNVFYFNHVNHLENLH